MSDRLVNPSVFAATLAAVTNKRRLRVLDGRSRILSFLKKDVVTLAKSNLFNHRFAHPTGHNFSAQSPVVALFVGMLTRRGNRKLATSLLDKMFSVLKHRTAANPYLLFVKFLAIARVYLRLHKLNRHRNVVKLISPRKQVWSVIKNLIFASSSNKRLVSFPRKLADEVVLSLKNDSYTMRCKYKSHRDTVNTILKERKFFTKKKTAFDRTLAAFLAFSSKKNSKSVNFKTSRSVVRVAQKGKKIKSKRRK